MEDNDASMQSLPAKRAPARSNEAIASSPPTRMVLSSPHAKHPQSGRSNVEEDQPPATSDAIEAEVCDTEEVESRLAALEASIKVELEKKDQIIKSHSLRIVKLEEWKKLEMRRRKKEKRVDADPASESDEAPMGDENIADDGVFEGVFEGVDVDKEEG